MKKFLLYTLIIAFTISCKDDPRKRKENAILSATLISSNVDGLTIDKVITFTEEKIAFLLPNKTIPKGINPLTMKVDLELSEKATVDAPAEFSFTKPEDFIIANVKAENGDVAEWKIYFAGNQLAYNRFTKWTAYNDNGIPYKEPLEKGNIFWNTTNFISLQNGFAGIDKYPDGSTKYAQITTGGSAKNPLVTSAVFNGVFVNKDMVSLLTINEKMGTGIPYSLKPKALNFQYKYKPGKQLIKVNSKNGTNTIENLTGVDKCRIVGLLVHQLNGHNVLIGKAELISPKYVATPMTQTIKFQYMDTQLTPTHFVFFATSSYEGYMLKGAVGSQLSVNNLEFIF